jgi:arylsulfatase A-like enzyme
MIDTLRADHLGCYGYNRATSPNIDRLASEGVLFERCYSVASWTLPSLMSMFTGLSPAAHGCTASNSKLPETVPTLPERFKDRGYYCAGIVSNPFAEAKYGFGRGFDVYDDYTVLMDAELGVFAPDPQQECGHVADVVSGGIVTQQATLLAKRAKESGRPVFLFVLYFDPHDSYIPPAPYGRRFVSDYKGLIDGRRVGDMRRSPPTGRGLQHLMALYDGEIAYTDAEVAKLITELDALFGYQDTLTVVVADHGEAFAEHGFLLHGNTAYREEVQVPMIWRWPGMLPGGHRVNAPVSNMDIVKTLRDLMRFDGLDLVQGRSLWPGLLGGKLSTDCQVFSQKGLGRPDCLAVTQDNLRLHAKFGEKGGIGAAIYEVYDVARDPWEQTNLCESAPDTWKGLAEAARRMWTESLEIRTFYLAKEAGPEVELSDEDLRRLESLGYIGGNAP